jgi:hypothetical protein
MECDFMHKRTAHPIITEGELLKFLKRARAVLREVKEELGFGYNLGRQKSISSEEFQVIIHSWWTMN